MLSEFYANGNGPVEIYMSRFLRTILTGTLPLFFMLSAPGFSHSITLEEAINLAKENLPSYKAAEIRVRSTEQLYKASLGPYLPSLDASTTQQEHFTSPAEFNTSNYDITLSYTLFDGGRRKANREISRLNLDSDKETVKTNLLDLEFNVKTSFYTILAQKETLAQRRLQLDDSQKDYEVAEGRYKFGVARLSDVLQASVRLEQARFNVVQAEGSLKKAFSDLNSLMGKPLDSHYEPEGSLSFETPLPARAHFFEAALGRPEIKQAEYSLKVSESNKRLAASSFWPVLSVDASYQSSTGGVVGVAVGEGAIRDENILGFTARWNIFELGKFFRYKSSVLEIDVSQQLLYDTTRRVLLDVDKAYEDVLTASDQLKVAQQQLKQAEQNYSQAFGEYKVGKGDILSLVQAESLLSTAREQAVNSSLSLILAKAQLERVAGIQGTGFLTPSTSP